METLKRPSKVTHATLGFELLQGSTKVHLNHLLVSGPGSYAAHKAMADFYDGVADLADDFIEQYQGASEKLMEFPTACNFPVMKTAADCIGYLRSLYESVNIVQNECPYSEIVNVLDEIKSLINSTKYKLIFLK
jgi:hypothetical protein